jgi:hypothetical protein
MNSIRICWCTFLMLGVAAPSAAVIDFDDGGTHVVSDPSFGEGEAVVVSNSTTVDFVQTGHLLAISVFDDSEARVRQGTKVAEIHAAAISRIQIDFVAGTGVVPPSNATLVESHNDSVITIHDGVFSFLLATMQGHIVILDGDFTSLGQLTVAQNSTMTLHGGTFSYGCAPCAWRVEDQGVLRLVARKIAVVDAQPLGFPVGSSRVSGDFANGNAVDVILELGSIESVLLVPALAPRPAGVLVAAMIVVAIAAGASRTRRYRDQMDLCLQRAGHRGMARLPQETVVIEMQ